MITSPRSGRLVEAWHEDPTSRPRPLAHAAHRDHTVALCGATVVAWGDDWPESIATAEPKARCSICTQATHYRSHAPG